MKGRKSFYEYPTVLRRNANTLREDRRHDFPGFKLKQRINDVFWVLISFINQFR